MFTRFDGRHVSEAVFPPDRPDWKRRSPSEKAYQLAAEWLSWYEGDQPDPLSRWTPDRWQTAFDEVGYFAIHLIYRQGAHGNWVVAASFPPMGQVPHR